MIMFFRMFKIQCIYCSVRGKIMLLSNNIILFNYFCDFFRYLFFLIMMTMIIETSK
jgi:hypothetical protein